MQTLFEIIAFTIFGVLFRVSEGLTGSQKIYVRLSGLVAQVSSYSLIFNFIAGIGNRSLSVNVDCLT